MRERLKYLRRHPVGRQALLWVAAGALLLMSQAGYMLNGWAGAPFVAALYLLVPGARRRDRQAMIAR